MSTSAERMPLIISLERLSLICSIFSITCLSEIYRKMLTVLKTTYCDFCCGRVESAEGTPIVCYKARCDHIAASIYCARDERNLHYDVKTEQQSACKTLPVKVKKVLPVPRG